MQYSLPLYRVCLLLILALFVSCTKTIRQDVYEYVTLSDTLGTETIYDTTYTYDEVPNIIPVSTYRRLAIVPVRADGYDETEALYFTDAIENWFVNTGDYQIVSRSNIDRILAEQDLRDTGRFDNSSLASIGRILGANAIIATTLYKSTSSYFWSLKIIDSQNGIVLWGSDGDEKFSEVFPGILEPILGGSIRQIHVTESIRPIVETGRVRRVTGYEYVEVDDPTRTAQAMLGAALLGTLVLALVFGGE